MPKWNHKHIRHISNLIKLKVSVHMHVCVCACVRLEYNSGIVLHNISAISDIDDISE